MNRVGERRQNKRGRWMTIIEYNTATDMTVRFDSGYETKAEYSHFKRGEVKDYLEPVVCGVGYLGGKKYSRAEHEHIYRVWHHILLRCYSDKDPRNKAYNDCEVCEEWKNFQNFAQWYEDNYYTVPGQEMNVDKDLFRGETKIYSPETCCILPDSLNSMLVFKLRKKDKSSDFFGITLSTANQTYGAYYFDGEVRRKKMFKTEEEAFAWYAVHRAERIREKAKTMKQYMPTKIYDALMAFEYKRGA